MQRWRQNGNHRFSKTWEGRKEGGWRMSSKLRLVSRGRRRSASWWSGWGGRGGRDASQGGGRKGKRCNSTIRGDLTGKSDVRPSAKSLFPWTPCFHAASVYSTELSTSSYRKPPPGLVLIPDPSCCLTLRNIRGNLEMVGLLGVLVHASLSSRINTISKNSRHKRLSTTVCDFVTGWFFYFSFTVCSLYFGNLQIIEFSYFFKKKKSICLVSQPRSRDS